MAEWRTIHLRDACNSIDYGLTASATHIHTGARFLRITDIVESSFSWSTVPFVEATEKQLGKYRLSPGDIVIARTGATTGESRWIGATPEPHEVAVFASYLIRLQISSAFDSRFIGYALKSDGYWNYVRGVLGDKSAQPNASATTLTGAPIRIPTILQEQRAIAALLGALDDKIAVNERTLASADSLGGAHFEQLFAAGLSCVADGAALPPGWALSTLGESTVVVESGTRPKGGVSGYTRGVPSIGAESISRLARFDFSKVKHVPEEFFANMRRGILQDRDILIYKDGGKPGDFKPHVSMFGDGFPYSRMCINEHVYRVRMTPHLGQAFGYYWLSSEPIMKELRTRGTGAAIPGINSTAVKGVPMIQPPASQVAAFDSRVSPLISTAFEAAAQSRALEALRDALLPELMSGRLRVREAEKIAEDAV